MNLNAGDATLHNDLTPSGVSRFRLGQESKLLFDELETPVCLAKGQT